MTNTTDEISLFDIVLFAARHWLVLVVVPLMVAAGAYAWFSTQPTTYVATIQFELPSSGSLAPELYQDADVRQARVQIQAAESQAKVRARDSSPDQASERTQSGYAAVSAFLSTALDSEREGLVAIINAAEPALDRIKREVGNDPALALTLLEMHAAMSAAQDRLSQVTLAINALNAPPSVQVTRDGPPAAIYAVMAGFSVSLILAVLLLVRQSFRAIASSAEGRKKMRRIIDAFMMRDKE